MRSRINLNRVMALFSILALCISILALSACTQTATSSAPATSAAPPPVSFPTTQPSLNLPSPSPASQPATSTPASTSPSPTSPTPSIGSGVTPQVSPGTGPAVKITSPKDGDNPGIGNIGVGVQVSNFNLVDKIGQANSPGEGHVIYYLDMVPPTVQGAPATTAPDTFVPSANTSITWNNVQAGQHSFTVELVNNDNTPLNPAIIDGVIFNVTSGKSVTIDLIAQNIAFNLTTISVPAGAMVTINYTNDDLGIPHNIDVFAGGGGPGGRTGIFTGHSITGVSTITYKFTAPILTGNYKFQCDFHPLQMFGDFIVTQP